MFENVASTIFLTAFCHMLVPLIFLMKDGKTEPQRANRIALLNFVIVLGLLSLLPTIHRDTSFSLAYSGAIGENLLPAIFFYAINYWILREKQSS